MLLRSKPLEAAVASSELRYAIKIAVRQGQDKMQRSPPPPFLPLCYRAFQQEFWPGATHLAPPLNLSTIFPLLEGRSVSLFLSPRYRPRSRVPFEFRFHNRTVKNARESFSPSQGRNSTRKWGEIQFILFCLFYDRSIVWKNRRASERREEKKKKIATLLALSITSY